MPHKPYLSADEVVAILGIGKGTLYSYVSRGLIRSEETPGASRAKRYAAEDVETLRKRREMRRNPERAVQSAMHWGAPILESALTLIADGALYYRGHDVMKLATQHTFEEIAALLWTGNFDTSVLGDAESVTWSAVPHHVDIMPHPPAADPLSRMQMALSAATAHDPAAYATAPQAVLRTGVRILRLMTCIATGQPLPSEPVALSCAEQLQRAWAPAAADAVRLLDAVLILCADHELNVSSFTARCVASAGSSPYAAVVAALSALQGPKHGGSTARVADLLHAATADPRRAVADWLRRGEALPGFGHPLYPQGDPRGRLLLDLAAVNRPAAAPTQLAQELAAEVAATVGLQPNVDCGLVVLAQALDLPADAPLALFALGRSAGWIGHILEQYALDQLIRPRARYVGVQPAG